MRVLIVNAYGAAADVGGTEKGLGMLTRHLVERRIDVSILQAFPGTMLPGITTTVLHDSDGRDSRLRWFENHAGDMLSVPTRAVSRAIDAHGPDVVHTHNLQGLGTGVWELCRRRGTPVFHTLHDYHLLCPRVTLMRANGEPCRPNPALCGLRSKRLARWAGAVSVLGGVSEYLIRAHDGVFPPVPRHVIRNPMQNEAGPTLPRPSSAPRAIGYLGNLSREKGVDVLLQAASALAERGLELRIAGGGRLEDAVSDGARTMPNVSFRGVVTGEAKREFLASCDIGVIPSVWAEPGGPTHTIVEWLGAGRPTLVSPRGGLGEIIGDCPGAIAAEPTVKAIVSAVDELLKPGAWAAAVNRVRPIESEGEVERWVAQNLDIYRSLA
jgi:glycosyltransferase involved in cell wall biosynthesis